MLHEFLFYLDYARANTVTFSAAAPSRLTPTALLPTPPFSRSAEEHVPRQAALLSVSDR